MGYLDDLLLRAASASELREDVAKTMQTLQEFGLLLNIQKSVLLPTQCLEYLGLILGSAKAKVFLPVSKLQILHSVVRLLLSRKWSSLRFCKRVLGLMVATFEAVPYAQFHT